MTVVSSLPLDRHPWSSLLQRDDVVVDRGLLHLVHDRLTPDQAHAEDLIFVSDVLEDAGVGVRLPAARQAPAAERFRALAQAQSDRADAYRGCER